MRSSIRQRRVILLRSDIRLTTSDIRYASFMANRISLKPQALISLSHKRQYHSAFAEYHYFYLTAKSKFENRKTVCKHKSGCAWHIRFYVLGDIFSVENYVFTIREVKYLLLFSLRKWRELIALKDEIAAGHRLDGYTEEFLSRVVHVI